MSSPDPPSPFFPPPPPPPPPRTNIENSSGPADLARDASDGLGLIKPEVRGRPGYTLVSPAARRKLNQNESPFDFPPQLKRDVLDQAADLAWQRYPEFVPRDLLVALAEHYRWVPEGILVGNGSNELIQATFSVVLGAGDVVVAPTPTFSLYRLLADVLGARYVPVPLGQGFEFDIEGLIEAARLEQAKLVVVNSPNNPTGSALPDGAVDQLLAKTGALVVCDEAYQDFGGATALGLLARSSRLVVLRTFSKAFGLAGLRFGLALTHPALAAEIAKGKLPYNVNLITLAAARVALRHSATLTSHTREIVATRERFVARLRQLPGLSVYPTAANFVLIRVRALPASQLFQRLYQEYGILVRDVSASPELSGCLRISIGTEEDMDAVIEALERVVGQPGESVSRR